MIKLLVREPGTDAVLAAVERAGQIAASQLTYVETRSALARMRAAGRLTRRDQTGRTKSFAALWLDTAVVAADDVVLERAAQLAEDHLLRAYDAVQLASAMELAEYESVRFASFDEQLNAAASGERLALVELSP